MTILGSKILCAIENEFFRLFLHLKLRRECEENCMKVGESKVSIGLQGSYKIMFSLDGH